MNSESITKRQFRNGELTEWRKTNLYKEADYTHEKNTSESLPLSRQGFLKLIGLLPQMTGRCHLRHRLHRLKVYEDSSRVCRWCGDCVVSGMKRQNKFYSNESP